MDCHECRVLIGIRQVLGDVLKDQPVAFWLHVRIYERSQVEVRTPVEVQLVLNDLVDGLRVCTCLRDAEFGNLTAGGVARAIDVVVGCSLMMLLGALFGGMFTQGCDELVGVDLVEFC